MKNKDVMFFKVFILIISNFVKISNQWQNSFLLGMEKQITLLV